MNLDGLQISWYGLFGLIGMLAGFFVCLFLRDKGMKKVDVICGYLFSLLGLVFGAKLLYLATNWQSLQINNLVDILVLVFAGFSFYGAIGGSITVMVFYCKICKLDLKKMAEPFAVALCAIYAFARIGCVLTGCCYGIPYGGACAVAGFDGASRFPVQMLDCLLHAGIFAILLVCRKYGKNSVTVFWLLHSLDRFLLDFLRDRGAKTMAGPLSVSQWISIILVLLFLGISIKMKKSSSTKCVSPD